MQSHSVVIIAMQKKTVSLRLSVHVKSFEDQLQLINPLYYLSETGAPSLRVHVSIKLLWHGAVMDSHN